MLVCDSDCNLCCVSCRKKQVAVFLLNVGADVSVQAKNGCTAFDMASLIGEFRERERERERERCMFVRGRESTYLFSVKSFCFS